MDQLASGQQAMNNAISRLNEEKSALERMVESYVARQERATSQNQVLLTAMSTFAEKDGSMKAQVRSLISERDARDASLKSTILRLLQDKVDQDAKGSSEIEELFTQSAASVVEMRSAVESLITDSDMVSFFQVEQSANIDDGHPSQDNDSFTIATPSLGPSTVEEFNSDREPVPSLMCHIQGSFFVLIWYNCRRHRHRT